jgi:hypothetical protein
MPGLNPSMFIYNTNHNFSTVIDGRAGRNARASIPIVEFRAGEVSKSDVNYISTALSGGIPLQGLSTPPGG